MNYRIYNIEGNIECDTDNLSEKLENIMGLLVEYENKVNAFFNKLKFFSDKDAWFGNNAVLYTKLAMQDKQDYIEFGENVKNIVRIIRDFARELDEQIIESEDICENSRDSYISYYY